MTGGTRAESDRERAEGFFFARFNTASDLELEAYEEGQGTFWATPERYQTERSERSFCPYSSLYATDGRRHFLMGFWTWGWRQALRQLEQTKRPAGVNQRAAARDHPGAS